MRLRHYIISGLAAAAWLFGGCSQLEEVRMESPEGIRPPVLNYVNEQTIKIENSKLDNEVTFAWDAADFGVRAQVRYNLEAEYLESGKITVTSGISGTSVKLTYEEINYVLGLDTKLGGAGVPLDQPTDVDFYISAYVGDGSQTVWSDPFKLNVTVIYAKPRYPNVWVIGKYCNWEHSRSQFLYSFDNNGVYEGLVDFGEDADTDNYGDGSDCGFKLTGAANWSNSTGNWGMTRAITSDDYETDEIQLGNGGGNINKVYNKRYCQFRYTANSLLLERLLSFDRMDVSGTAAGEEAPEILFDSANQRFYIDVEAGADGTVLFSLRNVMQPGQDETLEVALGASGEAEAEPGKGTLALGSDKPLTAPSAGQFRVYLDMNNPEEMTYEFNADDYGKVLGEEEEITVPNGETWGIVGTMNDWGGEDDPETEEDESIADIPMIESGDWFKASSVALTEEDSFKIRFANRWEEDNTDNFGGTNADAVNTGNGFASKPMSEGSSNNVKVSVAGTYDLYFNPELGALHIRPEGSEAPGDITWGVVGNMTDWADGNDLLMEEVEGTDYYVLRNISLVAEGDAGDQSQFKIRYGNWWNQNADNGRGMTRVDASDVVPIEEGRTVTLDKDGGSANIGVTETGVYNIYFYPNQNAIMLRSEEGDVPATVGWGISGYWTGWEENADVLMTYREGYNVAEDVVIPAYDPASYGPDTGFILRYGNTGGGREFGMPSGAEASIESRNTAVRLSYDSGAQNIEVAPGTYDIYFDADHGIIYINEPDSDAPSPYSIGIWAENFTSGIPDVPMTVNGTYYVCYTAVFPENDRIRIRISDNDGISYGVQEQPANGAVNTEIPAVTGEDGEPLEVPAGSYQVWFDMNSSKLYVMTDGRHPDTADKPGPRPDLPLPDPAPALDESLLDYKAAGVHNGWSDDMETSASPEGLIYWTGLVFPTGSADAAGGHFKIKLSGSWDDATTYGVEGETIVEPGKAVAVKNTANGGSRNISVPEREEPYDVYMDFANKVVFLADAGETDVLRFGIVGDMTDWASDIAPAGEMEGYPGVYVWRDVEFGAGDSFKIRSGGDWVYQFSAGTDLLDRTKAQAYFNGDNMSVPVPGTYDVYFDYPNKQVWIDKQ